MHQKSEDTSPQNGRDIAIINLAKAYPRQQRNTYNLATERPTVQLKSG